jgi:catechol 2,3-dioxygenase-like lactoylglutathione lyase family enzyme
VVAFRYLVDDVDDAVAFYTGQLGFTLKQQMGPAFAIVVYGDTPLWLSGPASSATRPMPDGAKPEPGGWNRIALEVDDIEAEVTRLMQTGVRFRGEIVVGPGGSQIVLEDPSGNAVELFQPAAT